MDGNSAVIDALKSLLVDESSARQQYMAHEAAMRDCGYSAFADIIKARGEAEAEHADELLARIYLLNGSPDMATLRDVRVGDSPVSILENDADAEKSAVEHYNAAAVLALAAGDITSFSLLQHIAGEEEKHLNDLLALVAQVNEMGLDNWLSTMAGR